MPQIHEPRKRGPVPISPLERRRYRYEATGTIAPENVRCTVRNQSGGDITNVAMPGGNTGTVSGLFITLPIIEALPAGERVRVDVLYDDPPEQHHDWLLLEVEP